MANSRYNEMNLLEDWGISRSLLMLVAIMPRIKNSRVGLVRLEMRICVSMFFVSRAQPGILQTDGATAFFTAKCTAFVRLQTIFKTFKSVLLPI